MAHFSTPFVALFYTPIDTQGVLWASSPLYKHFLQGCAFDPASHANDRVPTHGLLMREYSVAWFRGVLCYFFCVLELFIQFVAFVSGESSLVATGHLRARIRMGISAGGAFYRTSYKGKLRKKVAKRNQILKISRGNFSRRWGYNGIGSRVRKTCEKCEKTGGVVLCWS